MGIMSDLGSRGNPAGAFMKGFLKKRLSQIEGKEEEEAKIREEKRLAEAAREKFLFEEGYKQDIWEEQVDYSDAKNRDLKEFEATIDLNQFLIEGFVNNMYDYQNKVMDRWDLQQEEFNQWSEERDANKNNIANATGLPKELLPQLDGTSWLDSEDNAERFINIVKDYEGQDWWSPDFKGAYDQPIWNMLTNNYPSTLEAPRVMELPQFNMQEIFNTLTNNFNMGSDATKLLLTDNNTLVQNSQTRAGGGTVKEDITTIPEAEPTVPTVEAEPTVAAPEAEIPAGAIVPPPEPFTLKTEAENAIRNQTKSLFPNLAPYIDLATGEIDTTKLTQPVDERLATDYRNTLQYAPLLMEKAYNEGRSITGIQASTEAYNIITGFQNTFVDLADNQYQAWSSQPANMDKSSQKWIESVYKDISASTNPSIARSVVEKIANELTTTGKGAKISDDIKTAAQTVLNVIDTIQAGGSLPYDMTRFYEEGVNTELQRLPQPTYVDFNEDGELVISDTGEIVTTETTGTATEGNKVEPRPDGPRGKQWDKKYKEKFDPITGLELDKTEKEPIYPEGYWEEVKKDLESKLPFGL